MPIKTVQFGQGEDAKYVVADTDTDTPLFMVRVYDGIADHAFTELEKAFTQILAHAKMQQRLKEASEQK